MPYEYTPPKYAQLISELQRRMESGEYPPGSLLPSEHQLAAEFGLARPTVVRALRVLRQEGWIETQQGKGSFVRGRPALADIGSERRGQAELDRDESREDGELLTAGLASAPPRINTRLGVKLGDELFCRSLLVRREGIRSEIVSWWLPPDLAEGTGLDSAEPLRGGVRSLLRRAKGVRIDHVVELVSARNAGPEVAELLNVPAESAILALYVTAREADGRPVLVVEVILPADMHELEDAYPVTSPS